ncbi:ABC transporter ATP-binding protein [Telmatospirillum sp. J64-1]|uniref:ABC transporter ATP-binding protein n=1 Tax=Telmatospirillum sp. J64-1 TaxID=2502183 RepID=UPI00115C7FFF|nr:ABC transporter ATP-binding protein [Telmatospirillum sp. J64-1]
MGEPGPGLSVRLRQLGPIPLDVALDCPAGQVLALVGPSGSGKSTTLRSVAGLYRPQEGRIAVGGEVWLDSRAGLCLAPRRRAIGMVFQNYALFPHMTALANIMAAMEHRPAAERAQRARELLAAVHLEGLEQRRPWQLSGGQQQRVAVARALARDPKVLLLDEPFSAVDRATRERLYVELAELRRSLGMPILLVTHDLDEASVLADYLCILHRGRTLQCASPLEVKTRPASPEVARLTDMRNLFEGRLLGHEPERGRSILDWCGHRLEIPLRTDIAPDTRLPWCVPVSHILLHRRDRPSRGEKENPVTGLLSDVLVLGEAVRLTVSVPGESLPLVFSVPLHVAQRNGLAPGVDVTVSLLSEGIHLMPPSS